VRPQKLRNIVRELFGKEVSPQAVAPTLACLDQERAHDRTKLLAKTVEFLFLDGISQKLWTSPR
jgi:hypothetical protein